MKTLACNLELVQKLNGNYMRIETGNMVRPNADTLAGLKDILKGENDGFYLVFRDLLSKDFIPVTKEYVANIDLPKGYLVDLTDAIITLNYWLMSVYSEDEASSRAQANRIRRIDDKVVNAKENISELKDITLDDFIFAFSSFIDDVGCELVVNEDGSFGVPSKSLSEEDKALFAKLLPSLSERSMAGYIDDVIYHLASNFIDQEESLSEAFDVRLPHALQTPFKASAIKLNSPSAHIDFDNAVHTWLETAVEYGRSAEKAKEIEDFVERGTSALSFDYSDADIVSFANDFDDREVG